MTQPPLIPIDDEGARNRIREAREATLLVEAGAGTGKTRALVDRVVSLVIHGTSIERIAAITFTEKAATELRDRIRGGLEEALSEHPDQADRLNDALGSLERAQISTIHAFGQALLRGFAAQAGVDPGFVVSDEVKAERRLQEHWRTYLDNLAGDANTRAAIHRALGVGLLPRDIEALARGLTARAELLPLWRDNPPGPRALQWPDLDVLSHRLDALRTTDVSAADELRVRVDRIIALVKDLISTAEADREIILASASALLTTKFGVSRADIWDGRIGEVREVARETCEDLNEALSACRCQALFDLMPVIVAFVEREAEARGRDGELTFDDLILRTRDLLKDDADAVRSLRERYDTLLIDEFQDTDRLQVDIAVSFATNPSSGRLDPGRLFLVGDPKQSIYRFRRADMGIYAHTRDLIQREGGDFPVLSKNRRSRTEIVQWVNRVFEQLIGSGGDPAVQPRYLPIFEDRGDSQTGPAVGSFGYEVSDGRNAREVRQLESTDAASICRMAVSDQWEVWDSSALSSRPARYRDIALLMPARNVLVPLERSLAEGGVPYRVEGGSLVYRTQEVRDLINCLAAINDPADEVAIVAALRSPAFACSDVDLAVHRSSGGAFNYVRPDRDGGEERVNTALAELARYHEDRHGDSLAALVERFVAERGLVETGVLDRGDRDSFRRMRFVVEQARAFEAAGPESLRELISWLESRSAREILDNEGAGLDDDEDAVRILTIHGAKGLEFPIVLLVGLGTQPNNRTENYLADLASGEVAVSIGPESGNRRFQLGECEALGTLERAHSEAEFVRMLYVAATRARDHLVFSLYRKKGMSRSAAGLLEGVGADRIADRLQPSPTDIPASGGKLAGLTVDLPAESTPEAFAASRDVLVSATRRRVYTSATAEVSETADRASRKEDAGDAAEPWARGRGGTRLGRAVHAAIQSLPWDAEDSEVQAFARAQAVAEAIPGRVADVARLVRRALASDAAGRAIGATRALREVPFAVQSGDVTLEGFIDLVIDSPDGIEIVDWKTDQISGSDVEARVADYALQAGLYVWGLQAAVGRPVNRVTYVFVSAGREISPGDPATLADQAQRHLSARSAATRQSQSPFA